MIVFMHVPKTAGMHFRRRCLEVVYGPGELIFDYDDDPVPALARCHTDPIGFRRATRTFVQQLPPTAKMIFGHFSATKYFDMFPHTEWMAWVRHPVSRLISNYFYLKTYTRVPTERHAVLEAIRDGISFAEFCEIPVTQNVMTQLFFRFLEPEEFAFLGIQEHFAEDLEALRQRLGWPELQLPTERVNSNKFPGYSETAEAILADQDLLRKVERLNRVDMAFYQRALLLRNQRLLATDRARPLAFRQAA